jgi:hypothetical protein
MRIYSPKVIGDKIIKHYLNSPQIHSFRIVGFVDVDIEIPDDL